MPELKTINASSELSKPQNESWELVVQWVSLLALHFRAEISEPEIRIYCESLASKDRESLSVAMRRCMEECEFMPKLKHVLDRLPEKRSYYVSPDFVAVKDYYEPDTENTRCHVWEDKDGYRRVK